LLSLKPTRRRFLAGLAGTGALAAVGPLLEPVAALAGSRATAGLPSLEEYWSWQEHLVGFGTRYTGSRGQAGLVEWLAEQFGAIPGFSVRRDRHLFNRWLADGFSLAVSPAAGVPPQPVPVSYYYPYSGATGPKGVSGRLVDLGTYPPAVVATSGTGQGTAFWEQARGAIALVRATPSQFSLAVGQTATGGYEPGKSSAQAAADYEAYISLLNNPAFVGIFEPVPLLDAKNAGVKGVVVAYTGFPDDEVANQYNPFITPYASSSGLATPGDPGCPCLWVGDATGSRLSALARGGQAEAELVLTAGITAGAATDTIWGVLKGSGGSGEAIIVNTHTDGPNSFEENGFLGLLALARHFAAVGHSRDLIFVMVTGHFQLPQFTRPIPNARPEVGSDATSVWMADHPDQFKRAVLGVTVEHLGCTMWTDSGPSYVATGGFEWGPTYTMQREGSTALVNAEQEAYLAAVAAVNAAGHTNFPTASIMPGAVPIYFGEGAPLYAGGLGTVSLIPAPTYLLQAGDPQNPRLLDLDKLDPRLAYGQLLTFARTIEILDTTPTSAL
jgi:hypothetical protein